MITRELESMLVQFSGYQPGEIDQRTRPLRQRFKIPHGPRGTHAPHLEPLHVALVVLTMVARRAVEAGQIAMKVADLQYIARPGFDLDGPTPLAPFLALAFSDGGSSIKRVEIASNGEFAWVTWVRGKKSTVLLFSNATEVNDLIRAHPETYDTQGASYCGHRFVMTGAVIEQIRLKTAQRTRSGEESN